MRVSAIPAQITTVEDRIAGNLNLTQLILLSLPLFISAIIFFVLPPVGRFSLYKIVIAGILTSISSVLAIRVNDKLILDLIKVRAAYDLRPHIYTYRKSRPQQDLEEVLQPEFKYSLTKNSSVTMTKTSSRVKANSQRLLLNSRYNVSFHSKSGGLVVKVSTHG